MRKSDLDEDRLVAYAKRLDHKAAIKRIGFLLETYSLGRPETLASLQTLINLRYSLLDPTLPDKGPYRARWRLQVNLDPEELKTTVWT
jgi:predicted transcriptional regulator of viral defense system